MTVRGAGSEFTCQPLEIDAPRADEALVRVAAVGLCHADLEIKGGAEAMKAGTIIKPMFLPGEVGARA